MKLNKDKFKLVRKASCLDENKVLPGGGVWQPLWLLQEGHCFALFSIGKSIAWRKIDYCSLHLEGLLFLKKKKKCHIHRAFEGKLLVLISPLAHFQFWGKLFREQSCPCECMKATEQRKGSSSSPTPCLETTQPSQKQPQPEPCTQPWLLHCWEQSLF